MGVASESSSKIAASAPADAGLSEIDAAKAKMLGRFGRIGTASGLMSGFTYGVNGLLITWAFYNLTPLSLGGSFLVASFIAPLITVMFNDTFAAIWLTIYNLGSGRGKEILRAFKTKPGLIICVGALIGGPLAQGSYYIALTNAGLAYTAPISALYAVIGVLLGAVILKQKITGRIWMGIIASVVGAIVISYSQPDATGDLFYLGILFAFVAAFGWGAEGVIGAFGTSMLDPKVAINLRFITSSIVSIMFFIPVLTLVATSLDEFSGWTMTTSILGEPWLLLILALAGGAAALSYLTWYRCNNMIGVGRGMALNITYVFWGIVLSVLFLDTELTYQIVVGGVLIIVGAILVSVNPAELFGLKNGKKKSKKKLEA